MSSLKRVYMFDDNAEKLEAQLEDEGRGLKDLLGGKGSNLMRMTNFGIPVPYGFTVTTDVCNEFVERGHVLPDGVDEDIHEAIEKMEQETDKEFGNPDNPLLVSIRSGAKFSMPGMMDTVLNCGLNDDVADGMVEIFGDERFVYDAYRRLIMMFGDVVKGVERQKFEGCLDQVKEEEGVEDDVHVSAEGLKKVVELEKAVYKQELGTDFPQDPYEQLMDAVRAVFGSWDNPRAISYRNINNISHDLGTAVNVQMMVFGNMGENCGTGVAFTRDPATGENEIYGDYLANAQGEDVVAGIRTPVPIAELEEEMPEIYEEFSDICDKLEEFYEDMQDVEFTVEQGKLWMLQTRDGKRTAIAAIKIATDMVKEGLIDERRGVEIMDPHGLDQLLHPQFDPDRKPEAVATGVAASPGAAAGKVVFTAEDAVVASENGERVLLVRHETSPEDIAGMAAAEGILTVFGGKTSHAAVVGRQMGKPCVVGCGAIELDMDNKQFTVNGNVVKEGDFVSIDGGTGEVMLGDVDTTDSEVIAVLKGDMKPDESELYTEFHNLMTWADDIRTMGVRTNADTPEDAALAHLLGAQGIGLTRTEHMFFGDERITNFRRMIISDSEEEMQEAANVLEEYQKEDFYGILKSMDGLPVIIRLLDPPLHEFLPHEKEEQEELAEITGKDAEEIAEVVESLIETNPMLGHRGCRLGVTFPLVYRMQVRAIFDAACQLKIEGFNPVPEVMIPLVSLEGELEICKGYVEEVAREVIEEANVELEYMIGTMIELPRACLVADKIAEMAEFFSFGTNDLTQTAFGFSRDDVEGKFIPDYIRQGILQVSPFESIDVDGVGALLELGTERGRETNADLEVGICGEHGGEPKSVVFCHDAGLDYVSCSPLRVPVARLAAAQAEIENPR
ncbi:MAG: pyruvate, phosphate dikinase [Armatimonadota bacterium]